jgi:hypothetical protein
MDSGTRAGYACSLFVLLKPEESQVANIDAPVHGGLFAADETTPPANPRSTLKMPPKKALDRFHIGQIGEDTIRTFLQNGYSLACCCRDCKRLVEITPPELEARYGTRPDLRIADIAERLTCGGEAGCGSHDVAVWPHLYDGPWRWMEPRAA